MKESENIVFFIALLIIFFFGAFTFVKSENLVSASENRPLTTFNHFTLESFLDGSFQDNFESALSDQFLFSESIRIGYSATLNSIPTFGVENSICSNHYLELGNSPDRPRATFDCDDHMLYLPQQLTDDKAEIVADNIQKYNHINAVTDAYYYFINDSSVYNFETNQSSIDYPTILKNNLTGHYHLSTFSFLDYPEFKNLFYKTDHHWNYLGSYQGYLDITALLDIKKTLSPSSLNTNHDLFYGSHAKNTKNYSSSEEFSFYQFNLPNHTTIVNGAPATYGHANDYINHHYTYDKDTNYYAYYYGPDEGEIIYDYHQPTKDNLLIISNSFSNAINELIASHFNKTYIIDLRRYFDVFHKEFVLSEYLKNHQIKKTLLIMSPTFIDDTNTNQGLES